MEGHGDLTSEEQRFVAAVRDLAGCLDRPLPLEEATALLDSRTGFPPASMDLAGFPPPVWNEILHHLDVVCPGLAIDLDDARREQIQDQGGHYAEHWWRTPWSDERARDAPMSLADEAEAWCSGVN